MPMSKPNRAHVAYLKEDMARGFSQGFVAQPTKLLMDVAEDKPLSQSDAPLQRLQRWLTMPPSLPSLYQWLIRNTPISVFKWYEGFNPRGDKPTKVPVWVDFPNLPVDFYPWLKDIGSYLGTVLGQKSRGGFNPKWDPQLLIETDLNKDLIYEVPIKDSDGNWLHSQLVTYRNLPNACFHCHKMGHHFKNCPKMSTKDPVLEAKDDPHQGFQGFSDPAKAISIKKWLADCSKLPDILCLQELKTTDDLLKNHLRRIGSHYSWFYTNHHCGKGGAVVGIKACYSNLVKDVNKSSRDNWIGIQLAEPFNYMLVCLYASSSYSDKVATWDELAGLTAPLVLIGDFNMVETTDDRWRNLGQVISRLEKDKWSHLCDHLNLVDVSESTRLTWSNKQSGSCYIAARLDRCYMTADLIQTHWQICYVHSLASLADSTTAVVCGGGSFNTSGFLTVSFCSDSISSLSFSIGTSCGVIVSPNALLVSSRTLISSFF
ncbi:hypothetical protein L7F22_064746 [Adiantum nelumboides]|nr:hypothetical protein [Adiantum nelumboides]MCO5610507.1 hypothetical protein [Adiantum nelumboides]